MIIFISAQSLLSAAIGVHDLHHDNTDSIHEYFHNIGQPHEHDEDNSDVFEVSYSKQAMEHSNSFHDGGTADIIVFTATVISEQRPDLVINETLDEWSSPFIKYSTPPPKT